MSRYQAFWYKGIIKDQYRSDIAAAAKAMSWSAVISEDMKKLVNCCFDGDDDLKNYFGQIPYFPGTDESELPDIKEISFDEKTGLLTYGLELNIYHHFEAMYNLEEFVMPFITDKIIGYYSWIEDNDQDDHINVNISVFFKKDMDKVDSLYKSGGLEAILKEML